MREAKNSYVSSGDSVHTSTIAMARHLIMSNVFQKICTFIMNQVMLRFSGPEIFGLASIELELLLSTLLFLSRYDVGTILLSC